MTAHRGVDPAAEAGIRAGISGLAPRRHPHDDRGAGSILVVAILGALFTVTAVLIPVLALLPVNQAVQGAADAAALAAADTISGLVPGVPCDTAARAATLNGAGLAACSIDGQNATVAVSRTVGVLSIEARARAGPAP